LRIAAMKECTHRHDTHNSKKDYCFDIDFHISRIRPRKVIHFAGKHILFLCDEISTETLFNGFLCGTKDILDYQTSFLKE
jgi:hypothetical protein